MWQYKNMTFINLMSNMSNPYAKPSIIEGFCFTTPYRQIYGIDERGYDVVRPIWGQPEKAYGRYNRNGLILLSPQQFLRFETECRAQLLMLRVTNQNLPRFEEESWQKEQGISIF